MNGNSQGNILEFEEIQRLTKWWIWLAVLGLLLFFVYVFLQQIVLGVPVGDNPMSNTMLILTLIIVLAVVTTLLALQLRTQVNAKGVKVNFSLFGNFQFDWSEISQVNLVNIGFVGYGYRINKEHGTIFNLGGNKALQLLLENGKTYTVMIENVNALQQTLKKLKKI
jgi:hypothetical protein